MKIYFAGSIRGGRDDKAIYAEIVNLLKKYGEVLTEHVGDMNLHPLGQIHMTDEEIYNKDINFIKDCNVLVAEVTTPSLGVGYEIGFAENLNKKVVILFRPNQGKALSGMLSGNKNLNKVEYQNISELPGVFDKLFK